MSTAAIARNEQTTHALTQYDYQRRSFRSRALKIVLGIALAVGFGFATPYALQDRASSDLATDAANEASAYQGSQSRQIAMPAVTVIMAFMLWRFRRRGEFGGTLFWIGVGYCLIVLASATWTQAQQTTDKRLIVFSMLVFAAVVMARTFSVTEMALLGYVSSGVVGLMSLYADTVIQHVFAPGDADYRFTGLMTANYQAQNLLVCIFCALTLMQKRPKWTPWLTASILFVMSLLYLTRSRLSSIIGLVLMGIMLTRIMRQRMRTSGRGIVLFTVLAVTLTPLIYVIGSNQGEGAAMGAFMMGRTDTENTSNLSNRAPLWTELWESVELRPWLGYGYAGFWTPPRVEKISADQGWTVPHAHNTYLDQLLSVGFIGATLYVLSVWGACALAWRRHYHARTAESLLPAILLTWLSLTGIAESVPLDPYLPTMLAYTCAVKMMLWENSEAESVENVDTETLVLGEPVPLSLEHVAEAQ